MAFQDGDHVSKTTASAATKRGSLFQHWFLSVTKEDLYVPFQALQELKARVGPGVPRGLGQAGVAAVSKAENGQWKWGELRMRSF